MDAFGTKGLKRLMLTAPQGKAARLPKAFRIRPPRGVFPSDISCIFTENPLHSNQNFHFIHPRIIFRKDKHKRKGFLPPLEVDEFPGNQQFFNQLQYVSN